MSVTNKLDPKFPIAYQLSKLTLYLQAQTRVKLESDDYLYLTHPFSDIPYDRSVHCLGDLRSLIAIGEVEIAGEVIVELLRRKIPVVYFSSTGQYLGRTEPVWENRSHLIHIVTELDDSVRLSIAQQQAAVALRNYRRYLMRHSRNFDLDITQAKIYLEYDIEQILRCGTLESLFGYLGNGTQRYYESLNRCIQYPVFRSNNREEDTAFNRLLDNVYSYLNQSLHTAIAVCGLDPYLGIWHKSYREQLGAIDDFAVEFRHLADAVVLRLINSERITIKDFGGYFGSGLPPQINQLLVKEWREKLDETFTYPETTLKLSYSEAFIFQASQLSAYLLGEISHYSPLFLK